MGLFARRSDIATLASIADSPAFAEGGGHGAIDIRSPWQVGSLNPLVYNDIWGMANGVGRNEALSIPAVYRARAVLLSLIADKPLQAWTRDVLTPTQPTFLYSTPGIYGPWQRMAWTLDDLIFYGMSLWLTTRGAERAGRRDILRATRCPYDRWRINEADQVELLDLDDTWYVADEDDVILIPGPSEGLLQFAARTFSGAANLESAWVQRAQTPSPLTELHLTDDTQLDDLEIIETRDAYVTARRQVNGAVTVTPSNVEVIDHGQADSALFIEGRNGARLDVAAFFNLPGSILDASTATASLTYVTQEGNRSSLDDLTLPYWVRPIEARLSQDDVVPAGQSVRFDFASRANATIATED